MALINCYECGKEISDKATSCPNCGIPLNQIETVSLESHYATELLTFPELPTDLNIGKQIMNWSPTSGANFSGFFDSSENTVTKIPNGKVTVFLHTHGIQIMGGFEFYHIHNSQIISLYQKTQGCTTKFLLSTIFII